MEGKVQLSFHVFENFIGDRNDYRRTIMEPMILPDGSKQYIGGGYSVTIGPDGAIKVLPGDSISKYSMAIHGDFEHIKDEYLRKKGGILKPVENVNLIFAWETIYRKDSIPDGIVPPGGFPDGYDIDSNYTALWITSYAKRATSMVCGQREVWDRLGNSFGIVRN